MQQQRPTQSATLCLGMHHQILDVGTGPALRHTDDALGIAGDETQRRIVFGVRFILLLPDVQRGHTTTAFVVTDLHQFMHGGRTFNAVGGEFDAVRPLNGRHALAQVAPHQKAEGLAQAQ